MPRMSQEEELAQLSVDELIQRRNEVITLMQTLEDEHRTAAITDESYNSAKSGNQKKLDRIRAILAEFGIGDSDGKLSDKKSTATASMPAPAPASSSAPAQAQAPATAHSVPAPAPTPASAPVAQAPGTYAYMAPQVPAVSESVIMEKVDSKINGEVEKIRVLIDALKEGRNAADERMQRLTESIGELRSMLFNTDSSVKTEESKMETLEENIAAVDPKKVEKDFGMRDKTLGEHDLRLEKLERKLQDITSIVKDLQGILTSIGGLHNISDIDREITKKLEEIRALSKETGRTAERAEKMFVELNKRMDEFFVYRAKQEALDEISKDVIKSIDDINVRLETVATKGYVESVRESIKGIEEEIAKVNAKISRAVPYADLMMPKELADMARERESIKLLLSSLEEEAETGKISAEEFQQMKSANERKIGALEEKIKTAIAALSTAPKPENKAGAPAASSDPVTAPVSAPAPVAAAAQAKPAGDEPKAPAAPAPKEPEKDALAAEFGSANMIAAAKESPHAPDVRPPENMDRKERLLLDLLDSYNKGHITKQAYERAKDLIKKMQK